MTANLKQTLLTVVAVIALTAALSAQGIEVKSSAVVLAGSTANCTQPATIDFDEVKEATPEWKTIRSEGVQAGSARYQLLTSKMNQRIRSACSQVASAESRDCVVREGDIRNDNGLDVADLTDQVVEQIENS